MKKYFASNRAASFFAIILSVFFVVATVQAATTISTNIQTDGTLSVTGTSVLTGKVGIGTTTAAANLVVNGTTGQNLLQIATSTNQGVFVIDENGLVGIGAAPAAGTGALQVSGSDGASAVATFRSTLTLNDTTPIAAGVGAGIRFRGLTGFGNTTLGGLWVEEETSGSTNSAMYFMARGSDGTAPDMILTSSSQLGIGTTTPTVPLQVTTKSSNATTSVEIGKTGQTKGSCLVMYDAVGTVQYVSIQGGAFVISASSCK